jgi:hypothetical protein
LAQENANTCQSEDQLNTGNGDHEQGKPNDASDDSNNPALAFHQRPLRRQRGQRLAWVRQIGAYFLQNTGARKGRTRQGSGTNSVLSLRCGSRSWTDLTLLTTSQPRHQYGVVGSFNASTGLIVTVNFSNTTRFRGLNLLEGGVLRYAKPGVWIVRTGLCT